MKLLHLSDLHLGRRLCEMDLLQDQEYILQQCVTLAKEHKVSAVLVAGDVYDRSVPTVGAVNLLDRFLNQLAQEQIAVYIISGNHDSADRLGFAVSCCNPMGFIFLRYLKMGWNITNYRMNMAYCTYGHCRLYAPA